jgi:hypothetical protein
LPADVKQGRKILPETNTLFYLYGALAVTKEKVFSCGTLFIITDSRVKEARMLVSANLFSGKSTIYKASESTLMPQP